MTQDANDEPGRWVKATFLWGHKEMREDREFALELQDRIESLKALLAVAPDADRERLTVMAIKALVTR